MKKSMLDRASKWPRKEKPTIWDMTYRHTSDGRRMKYKRYGIHEHHYYCVYPVFDKEEGKVYLVGINTGGSFEDALAFLDLKIKIVIMEVNAWHPTRVTTHREGE